jgi:hypothetical protein
MTIYPHDYEVAHSPPISWRRTLSSNRLSGWTRKIAWVRVGALVLNSVLWAIIVTAAVLIFN